MTRVTTVTMMRFQSIAVSTLVFAVVGPAIGAVVLFMSRSGEFSPRLVPLSYVFGIVPAVIAGATYGVMRLSAQWSWRTRIVRGALAGCIGSLVCVVLGSTYTLVTAGVSTFRGELDFYGLMIVAGVTAGAVCALLLGDWRRSHAPMS